MEWVTVPILAHQNIGAMIVFVLFGLWMGRSHLRAVVCKAFRGDASVQDADEVMSYRTAVARLRHGRLCQCAHDGGEDPRQTEDIAVGYAGRDSGQCARFYLG